MLNNCYYYCTQLHVAGAGRELALETVSQEFRQAFVRTHSGTNSEKPPEMSKNKFMEAKQKEKRSESHYMNSVPKKKKRTQDIFSQQ